LIDEKFFSNWKLDRWMKITLPKRKLDWWKIL